MMDFPHRTDADTSNCPECGRPWSNDLDRAAGVAWLVCTGLACIALLLVIIVAARWLA